MEFKFHEILYVIFIDIKEYKYIKIIILEQKMEYPIKIATLYFLVKLRVGNQSY